MIRSRCASDSPTRVVEAGPGGEGQKSAEAVSAPSPATIITAPSSLLGNSHLPLAQVVLTMKRVVLTKIVSTIGSALYVHLNRASDTHAHGSKFGKSRVSGARLRVVWC